MTVTKEQLAAWQQELRTAEPPAVLQWAVARFGERLAFATSLGAEDQALTAMVAATTPRLRCFTLDTGRLHPETYELLARTQERFGVRIEVMFPDATQVEEMVRTHGINLFYESVAHRQRCCGVRKLAPLRRALAGLDAWVVGLRREQAVTRQDLQVVDWDEANGLVKVAPLWNWTQDQVWDYVRRHHVPYNPLHDRGFLSIGCACCTRAVKPGEDVRAGRWWWENPQTKECGLHFEGGKAVPNRRTPDR